MKLSSYKLELSILHYITKQGKIACLKTISKLSKEHFYNEATQEIFERIKTQAVKGDIPSWGELKEDPVFSESTQEIIKSFSPKKQKDGFAERAIEKLNEYRKARTLSDLADMIKQTLGKDKVDLEDLQHNAADKLSIALNQDNEASFYHIGMRDNVSPKLQKILKGEKELYLPSGFSDWDSVNKGIPKAGLTTIGASTGAGKSLMASQLAHNLAMQGFKVCLVPLEMGQDEMLTRWISNVADVSIGELMFADRIPRAKKVEIMRTYEKLSARIKQKEGMISYYVPEYNDDLDSILLTLQPYEYDCIIIDYVGLLPEAEQGEQQWRALGRITKKAHRYGETHDKAMVLLCQVGENNKIRYAGAIREDSKLAWVWTIPDSDKDETPIKYVNVVPQKSRGQKPITWLLKLNFEKMRASCLTDAEKKNLIQQITKSGQNENGLDAELGGN